MWPSTLGQWIAIIAYVIGAVAAIFSVRQYRKNSKQTRIRWLFDLHQRFYSDPALAEVRILIEENKTGFVREEEDLPLLAKLDSYLNFFEFVAYLRRQNELQIAEITALFEYPLKSLASNSDVLNYVWKYGYEWLSELLKELGYPKEYAR